MEKYIMKIKDRKLWGDEPELNSNLNVAMNWYNACLDSKELKKCLVDYVKKNKKELTDKVKGQKDYNIRTMGMLARMLDRGWESDTIINRKPDPRNYTTLIECLNYKLSKLPEPIVKIVEPKSMKPKVSIQQRMEEKLYDYIGHIEGEIDDFIKNKFSSKFKMETYILEENIPAATIKKLEAFYTKLYDELNEVTYGERDKKDIDPQLVEAWGHLSRAEKKKFFKFAQSIVDDCKLGYTSKKASRKTRTKKEKSAEKIIAKIKYLAEDKDYNVQSIHPKAILGAQELWIWNSKKNRYGVYYSQSPRGLEIKGTTLQNFDTTKSIQKRIRDPKALWKKIKDGGKRVLKNCLKDSSTKEKVLNGRLNENTLLIKAF
tara:strand:- start:2690 stop:3811 length:1122 start_codon:yes stop_codon:yes gene_type:complete